MVVAKLPVIAIGVLVAGVIGGYVIAGALQPAAPVPSYATDPPGTVITGADQPKTSPCAWASNPLADVEEREQHELTVITACGLVKGEVQDITVSVAGEYTQYHFTLKPDAEYASMLNDANTKDLKGGLMIEIRFEDQSMFDRIHVGQRLEVQGPHVTDAEHDWNEIHFAKIVTVL